MFGNILKTRINANKHQNLKSQCYCVNAYSIAYVFTVPVISLRMIQRLQRAMTGQFDAQNFRIIRRY